MSRRSLLCTLVASFLLVSPSWAATTFVPSGFHFELEVVVPGTPEAAFAAFTGETISWWDHHFSEKPRKLYFDTKPGGGFWEIFDDAGHGVQHAVVNLADPPRTLRFTGPLGLTGHAIEMVHTLKFEAVEGDKTRLKLEVNAAGQIEASWPNVVEGVWKHFLIERFKPYMDGKAKKP